jgi:hypothetical protein
MDLLGRSASFEAAVSMVYCEHPSFPCHIFTSCVCHSCLLRSNTIKGYDVTIKVCTVQLTCSELKLYFYTLIREKQTQAWRLLHE